MITNNWHALHEYFLITIEPLNCHIDRTIQQVCTSFQLSHRVFLGLSASIIHVQRKCLFLELFKRYIDWFSSMCKLITMAGSNFLEACKKYCGVGRWCSENHANLFQSLACENIHFSWLFARWGCFARRNVCDSAAEIPYLWCKWMFT